MENGQAGKWIGTPTEGMEVFLEIGDALDMDKERSRIRKELEAVGKEIERAQAKLGNASFRGTRQARNRGGRAQAPGRLAGKARQTGRTAEAI